MQTLMRIQVEGCARIGPMRAQMSAAKRFVRCVHTFAPAANTNTIISLLISASAAVVRLSLVCRITRRHTTLRARALNSTRLGEPILWASLACSLKLKRRERLESARAIEPFISGRSERAPKTMVSGQCSRRVGRSLASDHCACDNNKSRFRLTPFARSFAFAFALLSIAIV